MSAVGQEVRLPQQRLSARVGKKGDHQYAATGKAGRKLSLRRAFCVLTTRKHLETLGVDGSPFGWSN